GSGSSTGTTATVTSAGAGPRSRSPTVTATKRASPAACRFTERGRAGSVTDRNDTEPALPPAGARQPAIRVVMMPKDTNALGTIFGGIILSYIDQAGAVEAHRHAPGRLVTVAMREVVFHSPVFVGDLVSFYAETLRLGRTSLTI